MYLYVVLMIPLTFNQDFVNLFMITSSIHNFFLFDGILGEDLSNFTSQFLTAALGSQKDLIPLYSPLRGAS